MKQFDKEQFAVFFSDWENVKEKIETCYREQQKEAIPLMESAITNYMKLLEIGYEKNGWQLVPLNGEERLAFVKEKIRSHYSFIQLDALYEETKKKIAQLSVMK